jgi:hypothetical protein
MRLCGLTNEPKSETRSSKPAVAGKEKARLRTGREKVYLHAIGM